MQLLIQLLRPSQATTLAVFLQSVGLDKGGTLLHFALYQHKNHRAEETLEQTKTCWGQLCETNSITLLHMALWVITRGPYTYTQHKQRNRNAKRIHMNMEIQCRSKWEMKEAKHHHMNDRPLGDAQTSHHSHTYIHTHVHIGVEIIVHRQPSEYGEHHENKR